MEYCWLVQNSYDPESTISVDKMKEIASVWGSWESHRLCQNDNCIADDLKDASKLIKRGFNLETNLWTHENNFIGLERADALSLHKIGIDADLQDRDDLVAMALAGARYELVIALGFDLSYNTKLTAPLELHEHKRYLSAVANIVKGFPTTQFVFIDLPNDHTQIFSNLENFTCDNIQNVLTLVSEL